jgi:microcystin-dependent protein
MEPFIGEIKMVGFNFNPRGYQMCNGQIISIAQNTALFSLLGTQFGGNGQTTFGLPDLRSRVPIHQGQGPGLSPYVIGEMSGAENVTLGIVHMPTHTHTATVGCQSPFTGRALSADPAGNFLTVNDAVQDYAGGAANAQMNPGMVSIGVAGGSQPHSNLQPFTCVNFIIAVEGIFPSRN